MRNIVLDQIQENFVFVVGDQRYECPHIIAEFLSVRVCLSHSVDPSIAEYFFEMPDVNDQFQLFISLGCGSTIPIFFFVCLVNSVIQAFIIHFWNILTVIFSIRKSLIRPPLVSLVRILLVVFPLLFHILSHHSLKISTEDDLFSYTTSGICSAPEYFDLLQFIHFEYLSSECISDFLAALPDSIDGRLWESISRQLIRPVGRESGRGIISSLARKHGEMFTSKELSQLLQSLLVFHRRMPLISLLACGSAQVTGQVTEFAVISTKCTSAG
jgi:hypothetical protein